MTKPKIVFLDARPLINDDVSFKALYELGDVTVYDNTAEDLIIPRAQDAEIIVTNKIKLGESHFANLPKLRYVGETATGVDNIDVASASKHNIIVTNVPNYSTDSVAQHVLALLLHFSNHVDSLYRTVTEGKWQQQSYFAYWLSPIVELAGMTLGLLGFGKVGQKVALVAQALGMRIIAHTPRAFESSLATWVNFNELLRQSDILSLHCPLTQQTHHIINRDTIKQLKPSCVLINTGRGDLIEEQALASALKQYHIQAAYLDVLSEEPPSLSHPLINLKNCIITPHVAWASIAARNRLLNAVCQNIIHFLNNEPINVVRIS
jgi:glycerate dehydrogenase